MNGGRRKRRRARCDFRDLREKGFLHDWPDPNQERSRPTTKRRARRLQRHEARQEIENELQA